MKIITVLLIYFACIIEKIVILPFSNIRCSTIQGVLTNQYEKQRLFNRVVIGSTILLSLFFPCITLIVISIFLIIILIRKK